MPHISLSICLANYFAEAVTAAAAPTAGAVAEDTEEEFFSFSCLCPPLLSSFEFKDFSFLPLFREFACDEGAPFSSPPLELELFSLAPRPPLVDVKELLEEIPESPFVVLAPDEPSLSSEVDSEL